MKSLIDAALLDQERRILQTPARAFICPIGRPSKGSIKCADGCGRGTSPSKLLESVYVCRRCRMVRRQKAELHQQGWTASRSPCGPDDVGAR